MKNKCARKENGDIAIPTINPFLNPSVATTRTITKTTAVIMLPSSSLTITSKLVVSKPGSILSVGGYSSR